MAVSVCFTESCATAPTSPAACGGVQIVGNELAGDEAAAYCLYAVEERKKVEAFWGVTWTDTIRIDVSGRPSPWVAS